LHFFHVVDPLYVSFLGSTLKDHIKVWPEEADLSIVQSIKSIQKLAKPDIGRRVAWYSKL